MDKIIHHLFYVVQIIILSCCSSCHLFTVHSIGYGESIKFVIDGMDRIALTDIKLYYNVYPADVSMHNDEHDSMILELSLDSRSLNT